MTSALAKVLTALTFNLWHQPAAPARPTFVPLTLPAVQLQLAEGTEREFPYLRPLKLPVVQPKAAGDWTHIHVRAFRGQRTDFIEGRNGVPFGECLYYDTFVINPNFDASSGVVEVVRELSRWWLNGNFLTEYWVLVFEPNDVRPDDFFLGRSDVRSYFSRGFEIAVKPTGMNQRQLQREIEMRRRYYESNPTPAAGPRRVHDCFRVAHEGDTALIVACDPPPS